MERQKLEKAIVMGVCENFYAHGFQVKLRGKKYSDNKIAAEIAAEDEEHFTVISDKMVVGTIYAVYGNDGYDVIADYAHADLPLVKAAFIQMEKGLEKVQDLYWINSFILSGKKVRECFKKEV